MGKDVPDLAKIMSSEQIKELKDSKLLTICSFNKKTFAPAEDVKIVLEIKNIQHLQINLFKLQTINYYKKNLREFDEEMKLDGLQPSDQQHFNFANPPVQKCLKEFSFQSIKGKCGVYIIEFIGDGISSRAIIKIGRLIVIEDMNLAGHVIKIYNQDNQLCKGKNSGLYMKGIQ